MASPIRYRYATWTPPQISFEQRLAFGKQIAIEGRERWVKQFRESINKANHDGLTKGGIAAWPLALRWAFSIPFGCLIIYGLTLMRAEDWAQFFRALVPVAIIVFGIWYGSVYLATRRFEKWVDSLVADYAAEASREGSIRGQELTDTPTSNLHRVSPNPGPTQHTRDSGVVVLIEPKDINSGLGKGARNLTNSSSALADRAEYYKKARKWEACVEVSDALVKLTPDDSYGWVIRSFALHELRRTREAADLLKPAAELFPSLQIIRYNLACYECQLGNQGLALDWLRGSMQLGGTEEVRRKALCDPDLEPIWTRIAGRL